MSDLAVKVLNYSSLITKPVGWLDNTFSKVFYGRIDGKNIRIIARTTENSNWCHIELKFYIDSTKTCESIPQEKWELYLIPALGKLELYFEKEFSTFVFMQEGREFKELSKDSFPWKTRSIISILGSKYSVFSKEDDKEKLAAIMNSIAENTEEPED